MTYRIERRLRGRGFAALSFSLMLLALCLAPTLWAREGQLGDPAPKLDVVTPWVKGTPVKLSSGKGKSVYIIDFWATWCAPCRISIPHLTYLQAKYRDKGLVVVGISSEETSIVEQFAKEKDKVMDYSVAVDKKTVVTGSNGEKGEVFATTEAYMAAFGIDSIPHAFIVDKQGLIVWHGNPAGEEMETVLSQVLEGKFDLKAYKIEAGRKEKAARALVQYFSAASDPAHKAEALELGEQILKDYADLPAPLNALAWNILMTRSIPDASRDLDLALRAATQANTAANGRSETLDTLAMALFKTGKVAEAIKVEEKAIENVGEGADLTAQEDLKAQLEENLKLFRGLPAPEPEPAKPAETKPAETPKAKSAAKPDAPRKDGEQQQ